MDWRGAFLASLRLTGNVTRACKAAQIARGAVYELRNKDADFAEAWEDALDEAADVLEAEARRRAHDGLVRKKFEKGLPVIDPATGEQYYELEYSDTLLIFLLKGARPSKFRDNYSVKHEGRIDGTVDIPQLDAMVSKIYGDGNDGSNSHNSG